MFFCSTQILAKEYNVVVLLPMEKQKAASEQIVNGITNSKSQSNQYNLKVFDENGQEGRNYLRNNKPDIIVGPLLKENIPVFSQYADDVIILNLNYGQTFGPNVFQFGLSPSDDVCSMIDDAASNGLLHPILLINKSLSHNVTTQDAKSCLEAVGGSLINAQYYEKGEYDLSSKIKTILSYKQGVVNYESNGKTKQKERGYINEDIDYAIFLGDKNHAQMFTTQMRYFYAGNVPIYSNDSIYSEQMGEDINKIRMCGVFNKNKFEAMGSDTILILDAITSQKNMFDIHLNGESGTLVFEGTKIKRKFGCFNYSEQ